MIFKLFHAKLNTGGKTPEQIKNEFEGYVPSNEEIQRWIKAYNLINGLEVVVMESMRENSYSLVGWDEQDDDKFREYTYLVEQDPLFGSYIDNYEGFIADWGMDEYCPSGSLCFDGSDLEIIERLKSKSEQ